MDQKRQVSAEEVTELYLFTRKHFVEHYDVQSELVDHLANDIEQIWLEHPQLPFDKARDLSFKKFGVFGFMDVVEKKQKAMHKKYWKILWRFVKEWFTLPKFISTALIFMLYFSLFQIRYSMHILFGAFVVLAFYDLIRFAQNRRKNKGKKQAEKRWLLQDMIGETRGGFSFLTFVNFFNIINLLKIDFGTLPFYWLALFATLGTLLTIVFYVSAVVLPQKATQLLEETYPEYKMQ